MNVEKTPKIEDKKESLEERATGFAKEETRLIQSLGDKVRKHAREAVILGTLLAVAGNAKKAEGGDLRSIMRKMDTIGRVYGQVMEGKIERLEDEIRMLDRAMRDRFREVEAAREKARAGDPEDFNKFMDEMKAEMEPHEVILEKLDEAIKEKRSELRKWGAPISYTDRAGDMMREVDRMKRRW
jgi:hypothetical protein